MAQAIGEFSVTTEVESELFTFDFVNDLSPGDTVIETGAAWTCTVSVGTDADPQSHMGAVTQDGTRTTVRGSGFLAGVQYVLSAVIETTLGDTLELWAYLNVEVIGC